MNKRFRVVVVGFFLGLGVLALWAQSGGQATSAPSYRGLIYGSQFGNSLGGLAQGVVLGAFTPDVAITVTRLEGQQLSSLAAQSGCSTAPIVALNDGTHFAYLTWSNTAQYQAVTASQNFAAGVTLFWTITTAGSGCSNGNNILFTAEFKPTGS